MTLPILDVVIVRINDSCIRLFRHGEKLFKGELSKFNLSRLGNQQEIFALDFFEKRIEGRPGIRRIDLDSLAFGRDGKISPAVENKNFFDRGRLGELPERVFEMIYFC